MMKVTFSIVAVEDVTIAHDWHRRYVHGNQLMMPRDLNEYLDFAKTQQLWWAWIVTDPSSAFQVGQAYCAREHESKATMGSWRALCG